MKKKETEEMVFTSGSGTEENTETTDSTQIAGDIDLNELLTSIDGGSDDTSFEQTDDDPENPLLSDTDIPDELPEHSGNEADTEPQTQPKPKRSTRKKKADTEENEASAPQIESSGQPAAAAAPKTAGGTSRRRTAAPSVLTIESRAEVETQESREDTIWHEIQNAHRTRKILTGTLGGLEQTEAGKTVAIVYFKEFRIVIPMKEMMIKPAAGSGREYDDMALRQNKILGTMLGAEIDFIVKGIDSATRSVVASRRDAMLKKRQTFYMNTDASGMYRIYEDRVVQARVIAVADKVIRVEAFGVECPIMARDLSWDWLGDVHEHFSVGGKILIRILGVDRSSLEDISIRADAKSLSGDSSRENLKKCRVQGKYAGKVTDVYKGTVFVRLAIGVNAVAHSCFDSRLPCKKDDVSFAVTHIDEQRNYAVGIITRIIKQNI